MPRPYLTGVLAIAAHAALAIPAFADDRPSSDEQVVVVGASPLAGPTIDRDKVPANTEAVTGQDIRQARGLLGALDAHIGGIGLENAQNNPFQPNVVYRGFESSPLAGNAQGLAVYVDGSTCPSAIR